MLLKSVAAAVAAVSMAAGVAARSHPATAAMEALGAVVMADVGARLPLQDDLAST